MVLTAVLQSNSAHFINRVRVVTVRDAGLRMVMNQLWVPKGTVTVMNEDEVLDAVVSRLEVVHVEVEQMVDIDVDVVDLHWVVGDFMIATEKEIVTGNGNMTMIVVYMIAMEGDGGEVRRDQEAEVDQGQGQRVRSKDDHIHLIVVGVVVHV